MNVLGGVESQEQKTGSPLVIFSGLEKKSLSQKLVSKGGQMNKKTETIVVYKHFIKWVFGLGFLTGLFCGTVIIKVWI
tara:strand:- start:5809 stop:6042 length:234 start_codon:yes stop_codon:yes gene_type:complete